MASPSTIVPLTPRVSKPERRRHPRAITNFSAEVTVGARRYGTRVINLSMGGALLDFRKVVPDPVIAVGDRVSVVIRCRGGDSLVVDGRAVLWNVKSSSEPLLAIQFDEVMADASDLLEELMLLALAEIGGRDG